MGPSFSTHLVGRHIVGVVVIVLGQHRVVLDDRSWKSLGAAISVQSRSWREGDHRCNSSSIGIRGWSSGNNRGESSTIGVRGRGCGCSAVGGRGRRSKSCRRAGVGRGSWCYRAPVVIARGWSCDRVANGGSVRVARGCRCSDRLELGLAVARLCLEVGCVKQTISSQCDGYRQLRCLLQHLPQDATVSQNPPEIASHSNKYICEKPNYEGLGAPVPRAGRSFIKPREGPPASRPKASFPGCQPQQPVWFIDSSAPRARSNHLASTLCSTFKSLEKG